MGFSQTHFIFLIFMLCPPIFQIPIFDSVSMIFQIPIFFFVFVCVFGDGSHLFVTRSRCLPPIAFVRGAAFLIDICEDECVCVAKIALSFLESRSRRSMPNLLLTGAAREALWTFFELYFCLSRDRLPLDFLPIYLMFRGKLFCQHEK